MTDMKSLSSKLLLPSPIPPISPGFYSPHFPNSGVITSLVDMNLFPGVRKEFISGGLCLLLLSLAHVFVPGNGNYIVGFLDTFACPIPLLIIALSECLAISYIYGIKRVIFCYVVKLVCCLFVCLLALVLVN